jgi:hypothetical protein
MALLEHIAEQYAELHSWRKVAEQYPRRTDGSQIVKAGTLNRIMNEPGWLPKDSEILVALGLKERKQKTEHELRTKRQIDGMARKTKRAVLRKGYKNA